MEYYSILIENIFLDWGLAGLGPQEHSGHAHAGGYAHAVEVYKKSASAQSADRGETKLIVDARFGEKHASVTVLESCH